MNSKRKGRRIQARLLLASAAPLCLAAFADAQSTTRASVDTFGHDSNANSETPVLSRDGRFVAFQSYASNLVANDGNSNMDVFVHDNVSGITERVSVDSFGIEGDSMSREPAISADGRFVAFQSVASNLVLGDTNLGWDVFVHDRATGLTERVSVDSSGQQVVGTSGAASLSADGRFVAFASSATGLVPGDTNAQRDVFLRDRQLGTTVRISVASNGAQALGGSSDVPSISGDGRFIAFTSSATNLVAGDTNNVSDVFVRDMLTGTTTRVSLTSTGAQATAPSFAPVLALDGSAVAFQSVGVLVPGDTNGVADVFLRDLVLGVTFRISHGSNAVQPNAASQRPSISADGRFVAFHSSATNIVTPDTNGAASDVFLVDRQQDSVTLVSLTVDDHQELDGAEFVSLSGDGSVAAFTGYGGKWIGGDANAANDVYVRRLTPLVTQVPFCAGDSRGTPCPCGNDAPSGSQGGCLNSLGLSGTMLAQGEARVSADTLAFTVVNVPNSSALFLQGTTRGNGGAGVLLGDGLLCVSGTIVRLGTKAIASNTVQFPAAGDSALSVRGGCVPGDVRTYQAWYRNAAAFCTGDTFNLTNAWEVTWTP